MTKISKAFRTATSAAIVAAGVFATVSQAHAVSSSVKRACLGDYLSYCSSYAPGSAKVRQCMRANGSKLSKGCVSALVKAGYVSKSKVSRKAAKLHP